MTRFSGRITAAGTFTARIGGRPSAAESHEACRVLLRGVVADRTALCERLGVSPASLASDAALIARAYRRWGEELQHHVLGEYAAVVWDAPRRTALLTHDALGLEPLFWITERDGLAFATELVDLIDARTSAELDDEFLADYLATGLVTGERTPYRAIRRLLPGRSLAWSSAGGARELRTWNLGATPSVRCAGDAEYEERFRALLAAGIANAVDPRGTTWVSLSGGLDSSSIAAVAAHGGRRLGAYSMIAPRWAEADERTWMRAVVEPYELEWHTVDVEDALPFSSLPRDFLGEPTPAVIDERQLHGCEELLAAHGVTTLLSGFGGDTVLCASPGSIPVHLADALFDGDPIGALRSTASWKAASPEHRSHTYWVLRALAEPTVAHLRRRRVRGSDNAPLPPWLAGDYAETVGLTRRAQSSWADHVRTPGRQATYDALWVSALAVANVARCETRHETRHPLLYRPLVEFMYAIPWEQKIRPRCDRYLQRRALAGILPELVRRRASKASGTAPFVEGLRRSREWLSYLSEDSMMARFGIVDADRWRDAVRQAGVGQTYGDRFFLSGVAVEVWLKQLAEHRAAVAA